MTDAVIVSAVRTAVGKAPNGALRHTRPDDLAAAVLQEALRRVPAVDPAEIEDVILGCAMPEAEQGLNVARICESARRTAGVHLGVDDQSILRIGIGSHRLCGAADRGRDRGRHSRWRHGVDEPGAHGRPHDRPQPAPGRDLPRRVSEHGARRRKPRARKRDLAPGAGRVRARKSPAGDRGHRGRPVQERDPPGGRSRPGRFGRYSEFEVRRSTFDVRRRRGSPARHVTRRAREASAGLSCLGHGDGGKFFTDQRRRRRRSC